MIFGHMHFLHRLDDIRLVLGGTYLERVNKYKYLGIFLYENSNLQAHVDYLYHTFSYKSKMLEKAHYFMNQETALMLYKALLLPIYDYADICYKGF